MSTLRGIEQEYDALQSMLSQVLNSLTEAQSLANSLPNCEVYALNREISEILDICYDAIASLQASLAQIERIQTTISTPGSPTAITAKAVSALDTGGMTNPVTNQTTQEPQLMYSSSGSIDESERAFSDKERAIAQLLETEGKTVKALPETPGAGRNPDAEVEGIPTEFKSLEPGATSATVKNQINNSIRRGGQARDIIIDARVSGLTEAEAKTGLQRAKNITRGKVDSVRIIGDGYDITSTDFL